MCEYVWVHIQEWTYVYLYWKSQETYLKYEQHYLLQLYKVLLFTYLVYYIHLFIHSFNKHILILCARLSLIFLFLCRRLGRRIGEGSGSKTSLSHGPGKWGIVINVRYLFSVDSDIKVRKKPIPAPQEKYVKKIKSCQYKPNKII